MNKEAYEIQCEECVSSKTDVNTGNSYKTSYICNNKMESILKYKEKKLWNTVNLLLQYKQYYETHIQNLQGVTTYE